MLFLGTPFITSYLLVFPKSDHPLCLINVGFATVFASDLIHYSFLLFQGMGLDFHQVLSHGSYIGFEGCFDPERDAHPVYLLTETFGIRQAYKFQWILIRRF